MPLYTFNGSIPTEIPPGTNEQDYIAQGWKIAPDKPDCPQGKEVVWYSYFWIIRDPQPADEPGFTYAWNQDNQQWMKCPVPITAPVSNVVTSNVSTVTTQLGGLTSTAISSLTSTSIPSL